MKKPVELKRLITIKDNETAAIEVGLGEELWDMSVTLTEKATELIPEILITALRKVEALIRAKEEYNPIGKDLFNEHEWDWLCSHFGILDDRERQQELKDFLYRKKRQWLNE